MTTYGYDASGMWVWTTTAERTCWRYWRDGRVVNELRVVGDGADDVHLTWPGTRGAALAERVVGPGERVTLLAAAPGGSVLLEADTAVRSVAYAPHGHRDATSALAAPAFNGEHLDAGSGCHLLGAGHHRPYSPTLGMFLAPDSASPFSAGGLNTLAYCAGDPINRSDPSGHFWKWIVAGVGLALGVVAVAATFGAASAAVGAVALGGFAALTKSGAAAIAATTLGVLSVGVEIAAIKAEATGDTETASILGWVGLGLGIAGAAPAIAKAAMKGATRFARFAKRAVSSRSSAIPMRGSSSTGLAAKAAATQAAPSTAASSPVWSPASTWYGKKATYLSKSSRTFTTYPVSTPPARPGGGRPAFQRQLGVHPDGSDAALNNAILDELAWTPPPLKQYPSRPFTTSQYHGIGTQGMNQHPDAAGHLLINGLMGVSTPVGRWHYAMRRIVAQRAAWRDPAPAYHRASLPSYEEALLLGG